MFGAIIGSVLGIGKSFVEGREKRKQAKLELELVRVQAQIEKEKAKIANAAELAVVEQMETFNLDKAAVKHMEKDWKDDAFAVFFFFILFGSFIPGAQPTIENGLSLLTTLPTFVQYGLGLMFVHVFGFRNLLRMFLKNKQDKYKLS